MFMPVIALQDVAVACFLMLLWRDMYPRRDLARTGVEAATFKDEPWLEWGRPEGGFLDLGCVGETKYTRERRPNFGDLILY